MLVHEYGILPMPSLEDTLAELLRGEVVQVRLTEEATSVRQAALEDVLARFFVGSRRCMIHAGRLTLWPLDMRCAAEVRSDDPLLSGWDPTGPATPKAARKLSRRVRRLQGVEA